MLQFRRFDLAIFVQIDRLKERVGAAAGAQIKLPELFEKSFVLWIVDVAAALSLFTVSAREVANDADNKELVVEEGGARMGDVLLLPIVPLPPAIITARALSNRRPARIVACSIILFGFTYGGAAVTRAKKEDGQ